MRRLYDSLMARHRSTHPLFVACVFAVAAVAMGCSVRTAGPQPGIAIPPGASSSPPTRYFTAPPGGAVRDASARCVDSELPNITLSDYLAYWRVIFVDQRTAHPEGSFPSDASSDAQKTEEWNSAPQIAAQTAEGADARFATDVCGLSTMEGVLYSGPQLRQLRGHVAVQGRSACITIANDGTKAVFERTRSLNREPGQQATAEYLIYSAITNICPQLAGYTVPPNQVKNCSDVRPDPSARKGELSICLGG